MEVYIFLILREHDLFAFMIHEVFASSSANLTGKIEVSLTIA